MPIYHESKLIHVHISKTGGVSARINVTAPNFDEQSLTHYDLIKKRTAYHYTYLEILNECKEKNINIDGYTAFATVRNPFDRAISDYLFSNYYMLRSKFKTYDIQSAKANFNLFLDDFLDPKSISKYDWHPLPQYKYVTDTEGNLIPEIMILRFENLKEDYKKLNKGDLRTYANRMNRPYPYQAYYTKETYDRILNFYREDFIRFGYSTEMELVD